MEKNMKKNVYVHIWVTAEIITQHCKSTIIKFKKYIFESVAGFFKDPLSLGW